MANLTQAQVAAILAHFTPTQTNGGESQYWTDPSGDVWGGGYSGGTDAASLETGSASPYTLGNIFRDVTPGHHDVGDSVQQYDAQGNYIGTGVIPRDSTMQQFLTAAAIMAGPMLATAAGAGAAGAGAGGGYGAVGGGAEGYAGLDAASASSLGGGASINGGAALGTGAGTAGLGGQFNINGAGADGASYDATTGGYGDGGSVSSTADGNPYASSGDYTNGSDIMSDNFDVNGAHGAGGFGGSNGTWWSSVINALGGSNSGYGRILTSLLGGALGSHGTQTTTSTQRTIDPRMVPYVYGSGSNPGILGYTSSLLHDQMQPGALQGYTDMQNVGRGLLNQPVAGNGFNRFFGSR
jgi:hypothetical protein